MRRLKVLTTVFLVLGLGILLSYPFTVGAAPAEGSDKKAVRSYLIRLTTYFGAASFAMLSAAFCATLIIRRTRIEFAEKKLENLDTLLASQIEALRKKKDGDD